MTDAAPESSDPWLNLGLQRGPACELLEVCTDLLEQTAADGRARLRWYLPTDRAVVLGRGQREDATTQQELEVAVCQRPTGGGAVLMDDDLLSLDVVLPVDHPWVDGDDLTRVFHPIGHAWARALTDLGATDVSVHDGPATATRLGPEEQRPLAEVCYASLGQGEVTVASRKVVGLSQRRRRGGVLVQCGVLLGWEPDPLIEALGVQRAAEQIRAAAAGLDDVLDTPASPRSVIAAVEARLWS